MLAMEMRSLGASGMQVSRLCFGTLTMGPMQRGFSPERGAALLTYAYARGFRFLDTADIYDTYPHIRLALQKCAYRVSTKAYCWDKATASAALERAFFGLDREYVDVFMLHEQESIHTLRGHREALDYLNEQKAKGRIGLVGVSTHYAGCVRAAAVFGGVDVIHPLINVEGIGIQDGTRADMEASIAYAHGLGVGIFAMKPLGGGHLMRITRGLALFAGRVMGGFHRYRHAERKGDRCERSHGQGRRARCGSSPIGSAILSCRIIVKAAGNAWNFAARVRCPSRMGMPWWMRTSACCAAIARGCARSLR